MEQARIKYVKKKHKYNNTMQKMINFDDVTKENIRNYNSH